MELFQLKHFYSIAQIGNMTKAAATLTIAQPALSKSIRNLEAELGTPLFIRTKKGMLLTEQGEILSRYCKTIFTLCDDAIREINESIHSKAKIRLCLRSGSEMIGTTLSTFINKHPNVSLEITEDETKGYDFLIDSSFSNNLPSDAIVLLSEEICLAVSDSHPLANQDYISLSAFSTEKIIALSNSDSFMHIMNHIFSEANIVPLISYTCSNNNLLQELISMNMGISIAASINWAHSNPPQNIRLLHFEDPCHRLIYYKKATNFSSKAMQAFELTLATHFQKLQN